MSGCNPCTMYQVCEDAQAIYDDGGSIDSFEYESVLFAWYMFKPMTFDSHWFSLNQAIEDELEELPF